MVMSEGTDGSARGSAAMVDEDYNLHVSTRHEGLWACMAANEVRRPYPCRFNTRLTSLHHARHMQAGRCLQVTGHSLDMSTAVRQETDDLSKGHIPREETVEECSCSGRLAAATGPLASNAHTSQTTVVTFLSLCSRRENSIMGTVNFFNLIRMNK